MDANPVGRASVPKNLNGMEKYHTAELLCDTPLAMWVNEDVIRITAKGRDFVSLLNRGDRYESQFARRMGLGEAFIDAVNGLLKSRKR